MKNNLTETFGGNSETEFWNILRCHFAPKSYPIRNSKGLSMLQHAQFVDATPSELLGHTRVHLEPHKLWKESRYIHPNVAVSETCR